MSEHAGSTRDTALGVVLIGRNEGQRLIRALDALAGLEPFTVYVDSGSTDGSAERARERGVAVVDLDLSRPFTAGRARNEGFERLLELHPKLEFVQFIDGDCEILPGWVDRALVELRSRPDVAVVCGRRRERHPEASVYNRLCDMEWNTPVMEHTTSGGDAMMRAAVFREFGGFDPALVAGEEPDLCLRLRQRGWNVVRLPIDMTLHDAAMTRFSQWWRRMSRSGHATASGWLQHGGALEHGYSRRVLSALFWTCLGPGLALVALGFAWRGSIGMALAFLAMIAAAYAVPFTRARRSRLLRGDPPKHATLYAASCLLAKAPECLGVFKELLDRSRGRAAQWIEYKDGGASSAPP